MWLIRERSKIAQLMKLQENIWNNQRKHVVDKIYKIKCIPYGEIKSQISKENKWYEQRKRRKITMECDGKKI